MKTASRLFSKLNMFSVVMCMVAVSVFGNSTVVKAQSTQDMQTTTNVEAASTEPPTVAPPAHPSPAGIAQSSSAQALPTDQIIIKYKAGTSAAASPQQTQQMQSLSKIAGTTLSYFRPMSGDANVLKLPKKMPPEQVETIAKELMALPEVEYAEPDQIERPMFTPNDPLYSQQWDLFGTWGINAPAAWDITTGSSSIVVADIDTGITNHVDLSGRTVPGYDFISDPLVANDGNGRDSDPSDPGDWITSAESTTPGSYFYGCPVENSSWHGTHTAGTIGASGNNGIGVAGINWVSKILPVRVLGKCGGYNSDIADGMRWAAGLTVSGVPTNTHPARVLNLSLGGAGACPATYQNAINAITAAGAVVVVAAGNSNADASGFNPADCSGVITVAATNINGSRAYYSNYGSIVKISAPGGAQSYANDPNGILSTLNTGTTVPVADTYIFYQGTSMAAPHVTGVVSLMLSVNPSLTPTQVLQILQSSAKAFPGGGTCTTSICGSGILDAGAAIKAAVPIPAATLVSPSGTISTSTPTYTWNAVSNSTWYYLWVDEPSGTTVFKTWYTAAQAGCASGTGTCSVTPSTALVNGASQWWIETANDVFDGPWSDVMNFTVNVVPPGKATLVSPSGTISTSTPTYTWNAVSTATSYYLWVDGPSGTAVIQTWYTATQAGCASGTGTCSVTPSTTLSNGTNQWWIEAGAGAPWSDAMNFTVNVVPPGKATLVSPSGTISTSTPTYTWNAVSTATSYYLWVDGPSGTAVIQTWYTATQAGCASGTGTCSVTPSTTLSNGTNQWWIEAGAGAPWSDAMNFTVNVPLPGKATLVSPSGTISTSTPTYTWNAVSTATSYYLWVDGPSGTAVIQTWYTAAQAGCASGTGTCSVTPSTTLSNGINQWWIEAGAGAPWSDVMNFTVAMPVPGKVTLVSPSGTISTPTTPYTWNAVSNSTYYYLWVSGPSGDVIQTWYTAAQAGCASGTGTCSVTPAVNLGNGVQMWWIETYNSAGDGPWSDAMSFTVNNTVGFDSEFNGDHSGWTIHSGSWIDNSNQWFTTTGVPHGWASTSYAADFSNFQYQATLYRTGCQYCSNGILVRGVPNPLQNKGGGPGEWNSGYLFEYDAYGQYSVWLEYAGGYSALQSWTNSSAINQGGAWNTLRVAANGSNLYFDINGVLVWTGSDSTYSLGRAGITMWSDGTSGDKLWADSAVLNVGSYSSSVQVSQAQAAQNSLAIQGAGACKNANPAHSCNTTSNGNQVSKPNNVPALIPTKTLAPPQVPTLIPTEAAKPTEAPTLEDTTLPLATPTPQ